MDAGWIIVIKDQRKFVRTEMARKYVEGFAGDKVQKKATEGSGQGNNGRPCLRGHCSQTALQLRNKQVIKYVSR